MSSSGSVSMATKIESSPTCHFMRLPTEVREMIYRPLVIVRCVMVEHRMNSKEYDYDRSGIQYGPDQEYWFETAILATNRRIHEEVKDLCRRENDFVRLTSSQPSCLGFKLDELGLQMMARCSRARNFCNISMTITLDPPTLSGWPRDRPWWHTQDQWESAPEDGRPWSYIFCSDELPEFCRLMLKLHRTRDNLLKETVMYVGINSAISKGHVKAIDDTPAGRARLERLLGPLRHFHSLGAAQIDGTLSGSYKGEIISRLCRNCPTAMDIVHETVASLEQADEQESKDHMLQAKFGYKAALSLIRSCCWEHQENDFVMSDGPFPGLKAYEVVRNIVVRLQARIAAVYYKSSELRMARIYTERALDPRRPYDHRHNKIYNALDIQPWEHVVYAEVLHVAARISYTHGDVGQALASLSQAGEYVPFDEEQKSRGEAWQAHADMLWARYIEKGEARDRRLKKQNEKAQAIIGVIYNWKRKGERLFRSGRSYLAASVYQAALKKLKSLKRNHNLYFTITAGAFQGHLALDSVDILAFRIEACLAAASFKSRAYEEVAALTFAALMCDKSHNVFGPHDGYCNHSYHRSEGDWADDQKFDYLRIHYCRAMALYHLGDTVSATAHMEEALRIDPGDNCVFEKLTMLRQKLAEETAAARKLRLKKLNSSQIQLQKKQARRRTKGREQGLVNGIHYKI